MRKTLEILFAGLFALSVAPAFADDIKDGETLYKTKTCMACHGPRGGRPIQSYPSIGGQNEKYVLTQMQDIKSQKRIASKDPATGHPYTEGMLGVMHLLNEDDLKKLAKYISAQKPGKPKAVDPAPTAEEIAAGEKAYKRLGCVACHGKDGAKASNKAYPIIAGLHRDYLIRQMTDMREGIRTNGQSKLMLGVIKRAKDEDIAAIAAYISQIDRSAK